MRSHLVESPPFGPQPLPEILNPDTFEKPMPQLLRSIEEAMDFCVDFLDRLVGDVDLEDDGSGEHSLGSAFANARIDLGDDRECDVADEPHDGDDEDREPDVDAEDSLGWNHDGDEPAGFGYSRDLEDDEDSGIGDEDALALIKTEEAEAASFIAWRGNRNRLSCEERSRLFSGLRSKEPDRDEWSPLGEVGGHGRSASHGAVRALF